MSGHDYQMTSLSCSMVDIALPAETVTTHAASQRARALDRLRLGDIGFRVLTRTAAIAVLLILGAVIVSLISGSLPALRAFGLSFVVEERWNPVTERFGALAPIYGTLVTAFIAMLIAVPVGLLIALFLTELCPQWLRRPIGIAIGFSPASRALSTASGVCSCSRPFCNRRCSRFSSQFSAIFPFSLRFSQDHPTASAF